MTRLTSLESWSAPIKHTRVLFLLKIHMTGKATHAVRVNILAPSARGAQRHGTRKTRRETRDDGRSRFMHRPELPEHAADHPTPTRPTHPTRRCEERECAPRSSSCTLRVVVEAAGSVAGVTSDVVRLRSAVEEVVGDILLDAHRLGAGHRLCSAGVESRTGRAAQTTGDRSAAWRR